MITEEEVKKVANLARISLKETEVSKFQKELSSILDYVEILNSADTSGIEPLYQTSGIVSAMREDVENRLIDKDKVEENLISKAPNRDGRQIKVKSIISR